MKSIIGTLKRGEQEKLSHFEAIRFPKDSEGPLTRMSDRRPPRHKKGGTDANHKKRYKIGE